MTLSEFKGQLKANGEDSLGQEKTKHSRKKKEKKSSKKQTNGISNSWFLIKQTNKNLYHRHKSLRKNKTKLKHFIGALTIIIQAIFSYYLIQLHQSW